MEIFQFRLSIVIIIAIFVISCSCSVDDIVIQGNTPKILINPYLTLIHISPLVPRQRLLEYPKLLEQLRRLIFNPIIVRQYKVCQLDRRRCAFSDIQVDRSNSRSSRRR